MNYKDVLKQMKNKLDHMGRLEVNMYDITLLEDIRQKGIIFSELLQDKTTKENVTNLLDREVRTDMGEEDLKMMISRIDNATDIIEDHIS